MGLNLTKSKAQDIWGKKVIDELDIDICSLLVKGRKNKISKISEKKITIAKKKIKHLLISDWVIFVGISGSIAAGFAKEEDDIDIFIVVRNRCAWIYRGILTLRNIKEHFMRTKRDRENVKDLFCINFIVEERGLLLDSDIFNFHELMYLTPIYNERYLKHIYKRNNWLNTHYYTNQKLLNSRIKELPRVNIFWRVINRGAFILQILFMFISKHSPEIKRLFRNYKRGRIEFFPNEYKKEILKNIQVE
jgi:predicted nucleotidyltransferase